MSTPVTNTPSRLPARLGAAVGALAILLTAGCAVPVAEPYGYGPDYGYYDYGYGPAYPVAPYVVAPSTSIVLQGSYWGGPRWREPPPPVRPGPSGPRPPWAHPRPPEGHAPGLRPPQARPPDGHRDPPPARAQGQAGPRGPWQGRPHRDGDGDRPQRGERGR